MSATSFDVHTFGRQLPRLARTPLSALYTRDLDKREAAIAEREANVARRERALEAIERTRELKDWGALVTPTRTERAPAPPRPLEYAMQLRFHETFRVKEREWWRKQLGRVPVLS